VSQPPSGPPSEGPEPWDDPPSETPRPVDGAPPYGEWQPPPYGPPPPPYGAPPPYGPPPPGVPAYGAPPYGPQYGPQPPTGGGHRGLVVGLVAGLIVLIVCVAVTAVLVSRDDRRGTPVALPPGVTATVAADGTVTMAASGVTLPLVDVYEDFQCPICKEFHRVNDATLKNLAGERKARVVYHPIVIFNREPLAGNSTRASAAARCVTDGAEWLSFQNQLFLHQPPEGSTGFSTGDLVTYGGTAGVSRSGFGSCVRTQRYAADVRQASTAAVAGGVLGTPTVKVNGTALPTNETLTAEGLRNAVIAAG